MNQKDWKPIFIPYAKARKRIETDFSQFVDQFMLNRNYAKQIEGFMTRIISKISAFTIMQYVNYSLGKPITFTDERPGVGKLSSNITIGTIYSEPILHNNCKCVAMVLQCVWDK